MPACTLALALILIPCTGPLEPLPGTEVAAAHALAGDPHLRAARSLLAAAADRYWRAIEAGGGAARERQTLERAWIVRHLAGPMPTGMVHFRRG